MDFYGFGFFFLFSMKFFEVDGKGYNGVREFVTEKCNGITLMYITYFIPLYPQNHNFNMIIRLS